MSVLTTPHRITAGQAQEFSTALGKCGVLPQFVICPGAGHFPGEPKQIRDLRVREIPWMNTYLRR